MNTQFFLVYSVPLLILGVFFLVALFAECRRRAHVRKRDEFLASAGYARSRMKADDAIRYHYLHKHWPEERDDSCPICAAWVDDRG